MTAASLSLPRSVAGRISLSTGLFAFIWLLPFHIAVMAFLFGGLGLPGPTVRAIAAWKETLIAVLVTGAVVRLVAGRADRTAVQWLDIAVFGLGLVALLYLIGAPLWFGIELPLGARLYGLRDAVYFSLLYYVGRSTAEVVRDDRVLKALFVVGAVTSGIAVLERLFVTPQMLVLLGTAEYFQDFLGMKLYTVGSPFGLPYNYFVMLGGRTVLRAGSTYLSSQGFAVPFLVIMPAATVWYVARKRGAGAGFAYALLWAGLVLSITRMTVVACLLQTAIIAALHRRWGWIVGAGAVAATAFAAALAMSPGFATYAWETLTWSSASSISHADDWIEGIANAVRYPFGAGLGVADQTAARFGLDPLAGDNQYLKYAVEMGFVGLGLHLATMAGALLAGVRAARRTGTAAADYGIVVTATAGGILFNAITSVVFNSMMLTYVFFWLLGAVVTANLARGEPRGLRA